MRERTHHAHPHVHAHHQFLPPSRAGGPPGLRFWGLSLLNAGKEHPRWPWSRRLRASRRNWRSSGTKLSWPASNRTYAHALVHAHCLATILVCLCVCVCVAHFLLVRLFTGCARCLQTRPARKDCRARRCFAGLTGLGYMLFLAEYSPTKTTSTPFS